MRRYWGSTYESTPVVETGLLGAGQVIKVMLRKEHETPRRELGGITRRGQGYFTSENSVF